MSSSQTYPVPRTARRPLGGAAFPSSGQLNESWSIDDTGSITDAITFRVTHPIADPAAGTDAQAKAIAHPVADPAAGTDAWSNKPGKGVADPAAGTDAELAAVGKAIADPAAATDSLSNRAAPIVAEALAGTDAIAHVWHATVAIVEALVVTDGQQITSVGNHVLSLSEPLAVTDQASPAAVYARAVSDAAAGTDAQTKGSTILVPETITGVDELGTAWTVVVLIDELGEITDASTPVIHVERWDGSTDSRWPGDTDSRWPGDDDDRWPGDDDSRWPATSESRWS